MNEQMSSNNLRLRAHSCGPAVGGISDYFCMPPGTQVGDRFRSAQSSPSYQVYPVPNSGPPSTWPWQSSPSNALREWYVIDGTHYQIQGSPPGCFYGDPDYLLQNQIYNNTGVSIILPPTGGCPHQNNNQNIDGCTDSTANNYDPAATIDDGSCDYTATSTNNSHAGYQIELCDVDVSSPQYNVGQTYNWGNGNGITCNGQMCTDTGPGSDLNNPNPAGTGDIGMSFSLYPNNSNTGPNWIGTLLSLSSPTVQTISPSGAFLDFASHNCPSSTPSSSPCNTTPTSACAEQWFGSNASNFAQFMSNKNCSNYQATSVNLKQQATAILNGAPNPQQGPYNNWNDIKNAANASGLKPEEKGQFKRKMAKATYTDCQNQACNC